MNVVQGWLPDNVFALLGLVCGVLSALGLIQYSFDHDLGPTFGVILGYYDKLTHVLIGSWAEPLIKLWLSKLTDYLGWDLRLHGSWKHMFVLLGLYFWRQAFSVKRMEEVALGWRGIRGSGWLFYLLWGVVVALITAVAAGISVSETNNFPSYTLFVATAVGGVALFDVGGAIWNATFFRRQVAGLLGRPYRGWWAEVAEHVFYIVRRCVVGLALAFALYQWPDFRQLQSPGLAACGVLTLALAAEWLWLGLRRFGAATQEGSPDAKAMWALRQTPNVGAAMLGVVGWTGLFVVANAGLRFYGL